MTEGKQKNKRTEFPKSLCTLMLKTPLKTRTPDPMRRYIASLLIFVIVTFPCAAQSGPYNYAAEWRRYSVEQRANYLDGYRDGTGVLSSAMFATNKETTPDAFAALARTLTPVQKKLWDAAFKANMDDVKMYPFNPADVAPVMTQIYADASNAFIPWSWMAHVAIMKLRGEPDDKIQLELRISRMSVPKE